MRSIALAQNVFFTYNFLKEKKRREREKKLEQGKKLTEAELEDAAKLEQIELRTGKPWSRIEAERPKEYFIDVNMLFNAIMSDPRLKSVQNPVLYVVMAIVLGGTDYFGHGAGGASFLPGIGVQRVVWPLMFEHASEYSHVIQASLAYAPDTGAWREVVVDRDACINLFNACYLRVNDGNMADVRAKYEERERKRLETLQKKLAKMRGQITTTPAQLAKIQASLATPRAQNEILSEEDMHVHISHMLHNIVYWRNAWKRNYERFPDVFERDEQGQSYWGYDHLRRAIATTVSKVLPFPVDEVYVRHMLATKRQTVREVGAPTIEPPQVKRKNVFG